MNEKINLCEILKDCPRRHVFYSPIFGNVSFEKITENGTEIMVITEKRHRRVNPFRCYNFVLGYNECRADAFPDRDQRDWSKWQCPKPKFDPKTLKAFDRVLCCIDNNSKWQCNLFSHLHPNYKDLDYPVHCMSNTFMYAIPYNDDTKHLVGTTDEAPEYYRYWED